MIPIIFVLGISMGALGGILMKLGADKLSSVEIGSFGQVPHFLISLLTQPVLLSGMFLYFLSAVAWSYLLTKLDISFVQPILALTYVVTPVLAIFLLGEHVPLLRWVGIAVIILGVIIVARTSAA